MSLNFATTPTLQFSRDKFTPTLSANNSVVLQFVVPINLGNKLSPVSTGLVVVYEYLELVIAITLNAIATTPINLAQKARAYCSCFPEDFFQATSATPCRLVFMNNINRCKLALNKEILPTKRA